MTMPVMNNVTVLVRRSELAVEPRLSILHKHRRSLLRRLEQAHRTALDDDRLPKLCLRLEAADGSFGRAEPNGQHVSPHGRER